MQKTATDLLGLEYQEIKPKIDIPDLKRNIDGKYVCIAVQSTAQSKYWNNRTGWQEVVDFLKDKGYKVVCIDKHHTFGHEKYGHNVIPAGVIDRTGDIAIDDRIRDIKYADFFIGTGSGLSWLSWAVGTQVVMISGFTKPFCEFQSGNTRIHNNDVCNGCFNSEKYTFDRGNWTWCPEHENTDRMFECSKTITSDIVIREINKILVDFTDGLDGLTR
jgi:autotransporter strand-loop-strand O-heptosyltransferase